MKQSAPKRGRADEWTSERIGQLSTPDIKQLREMIKKLQKQQQQLGFGPNGPISPLEVLRQLAERAPADPRMNVDELAIDTDGVHLRAKTSSFDAVEKIRAGKGQAIGAIIGAVMRETKGRADGGEVQRLIRERIG